MIKSLDTFVGLADRQSVLTEILSRGPAAPGTTLIGNVDRASLAVLEVRSIATPVPVIEDDIHLAHGPILDLAGTLRDLAEAMVPVRTWTGKEWSTLTNLLVTVVCREGPLTITPVEFLIHYGWMYSNHRTSALFDVFLVTPEGWSDMCGDWGSNSPALPPRTDSLDVEPAVQAAEAILAEASDAVLRPGLRECLLCYVHRMLIRFGCDTTLRFAKRFRDACAPRATGLGDRLGRMGGFCDCEIFLNGYDLHDKYWIPERISSEGEVTVVRESHWPEPIPLCTGVRRGSTQPCELWVRRHRGWR